MIYAARTKRSGNPGQSRQLQSLPRVDTLVFWSSHSKHIFKLQLPIRSLLAFGGPVSSGTGSCCTPSRC